MNDKPVVLVDLREPEYQDREWLYKEYNVNKISAYQIAKNCNVSKKTILNWMNKYDIKRRNSPTPEMRKRNSESSKGKNNGNWRGGKIIVKCNWCSKEIKVISTVYKTQEHFFCSTDCFHKWHGEQMKGERSHFFGIHKYGKDNPAWKGGDIKTPCSNCNKEIEIPKWRNRKHKHHFCSKECASEWRSKGINNPMYGQIHSEETRRKIGERTRERFKDPDNHPRGMLGKHHTRETREKISNILTGKYIGENNPNWKGDDITYGALHIWVNEHFIKPDHCELCQGRIEEHGQGYTEWIRKDHDINTRECIDWLYTHRTCHRQYDINNNKWGWWRK